MKKQEKIVVALGGNALGRAPEEQIRLVKHTAKPIVDLIEEGHQVILAHGNGPQVGMINLAMSAANAAAAGTPEMPFPECGAMSQGYIGYHLQNAIREEILNRNLNVPVATVITQVIVDKDDPAFLKPIKPIGAFYAEEEAQALMKQHDDYQMVEDAGRGWRRVVASPKPVDVAEKDTVKILMDSGHMVITVGGGGIPVYRDGNALIGIPAVIDKDYSAEKIAELMDADYLIILTTVEKVAINFNTPDETWLDTMTVDEATAYIKEGMFTPGSMLPKVQAAVLFAASKAGRKSLITSLDKAKDGIAGLTGTIITQA
ncbi:MAG: carbamate kinase [Clostridiales bacterium]|jgi:carbamate kinase|nr:carbamate kinase [Clostridiales bacterium]MDN5297753.1 carbamate kinase [Clostridiales bacterium]